MSGHGLRLTLFRVGSDAALGVAPHALGPSREDAAFVEFMESFLRGGAFADHPRDPAPPPNGSRATGDAAVEVLLAERA